MLDPVTRESNFKPAFLKAFAERFELPQGELNGLPTADAGRCFSLRLRGASQSRLPERATQSFLRSTSRACRLTANLDLFRAFARSAANWSPCT